MKTLGNHARNKNDTNPDSEGDNADVHKISTYSFANFIADSHQRKDNENECKNCNNQQVGENFPDFHSSHILRGMVVSIVGSSRIVDLRVGHDDGHLSVKITLYYTINSIKSQKTSPLDRVYMKK